MQGLKENILDIVMYYIFTLGEYEMQFKCKITCKYALANPIKIINCRFNGAFEMHQHIYIDLQVIFAIKDNEFLKRIMVFMVLYGYVYFVQVPKLFT